MTASPALLTKEQLDEVRVRDANNDWADPDLLHVVLLAFEDRRALLQHIAALEQRVEADSKHAARYRWMRASGGLRFPACIGELVPGYDYDAGIDARIASETSPALPKETT